MDTTTQKGVKITNYKTLTIISQENKLAFFNSIIIKYLCEQETTTQ